MNDLRPIAASVNAMNLEDQPRTIVGSLLWVLKSKKFCNVIFTFPNLPDRIQAHKFILKARSPVFERIFRMRKSGNVQGNEIEITESTPERFQEFLEFIYSDKFEVDIAGALDLLQLSPKYKVHPLTMKCAELLKTQIPIVAGFKPYGHDRPDIKDRAGEIMVKSFLELVRTDALANATEETLVYLLESDDLAVQEVGLFQFIVNWGKNKIGASTDEELLRNKLKNLISKIRYTNMTPEEFTKVVVPTELLSARDTISVFSYFCGDEVTRRGLETKFNTTRRKVENLGMVTKILDLYANQRDCSGWFPAFSKHCTSFTADRTQVDGKVLPDYFLRKTVMTAIHCFWPCVKYEYRQHHALNFNVSLVEHSGLVKEGDFTKMFEKKLLNCKQASYDEISVEPPVELVSGRTYSVILEDLSASSMIDSFRKEPDAYCGLSFPNMNGEPNVDYEDASLTLKDFHRKTDFCRQEACDGYGELALIRRFEIGLM